MSKTAKLTKFLKYILIAFVLATALHFFNGFIIIRIIPKNLIIMFIYDVFSLIILIVLSIILIHLGKIKDYKKTIRTAFFTAIITVCIVYCIMLSGLSAFILGGIKFHVFDILFVAVPLIVGEYLGD